MTPHNDPSARPGSRRRYDLNVSDEDAGPVPRMVNLIVGEALKSGAQQVHFHTGTLAVRFLFTDEWKKHVEIPLPAFLPLVNCLRVMANLDRIEHNNRQEGTIEIIADGVPVLIRMIVQFTEAGDEEVYLHLPTDEQG